MVSKSSKSSQTPVSIDHALVQASKNLSGQALPTHLSFSFRWQGLIWQFNTENHDGAGFSLTLETCLGLIPFSAEGLEQRHAALQLILNWPHHQKGPLSMERDGTVTLSLTGRFADDYQLANLITAAFLMLIEVQGDMTALTSQLMVKPCKASQRKAA